MSSVVGPTFRFGRRARRAEGDRPLLASLLRDRWPRLAGSIRYHRPRGPFCGTGDCTGCLVRVNGRPNVRACRYAPRDGDRIRTENAFPSPRFDLLGAIDVVFPHGFDTVRGLRRPRWAVPIYQRVVRRLAGYGAPPSPDRPGPTPSPRVMDVTTVIVGAGRSGRAVAAELVAVGERPVVVEREPQIPPVEGCELLAGTTAVFLPPPLEASAPFRLLAFGGPGDGTLVRARHVVLASGGYDGALLFEGADRPGVCTGDLVERFPDLPFRRAVVLGGGARAAALLARLGDRAVAVVAPGEIRAEVVARANERSIPLYPRSRVVRSRGRGRVRSLELVGRGDGGRTVVPCDAVVLAHRRLPNAQLAFQAGALRVWHDGAAAYFPTLGPEGRTTVPGLFAVGSAAAPSAAAAPDPAAVARAIGGRPTPPPRVPLATPDSGFGSYYRELLTEPRRGKWVVCPCEDVLLEEVEEAVRRGFRGMEVVKRYTGLGTGLCQGRYCVPEALLVLSALEGRPPVEVGTITQRPPLVPTPLAALAGLASEFDRTEVP